MIPAYLYEYIYCLLILFLSIPVFSKYSSTYGELNEVSEVKGADKIWLLVLFLIIFIGLRPADRIFHDTIYYYNVIEKRTILYNGFDFEVENLLFDNVLYYFSHYHLDYHVFFVIVAIIYFCGFYVATKKLFPHSTYLAYLVFLSAFSTFSYSVNGIKAGAAAAIFMIGIAYREKLVLSLFLLFLSWGCHHSMSFPIAVYAVVSLYKKPKYYFFFWLFCLVMSVLHITTFQEIFAGYTDEKGAEYLVTTGEDWKGKGGFRIDFVIYSSMPVLLGWYAIQKLRINDRTYNFLLCYYLLSNGIWLLCMYVNYNNRIAYLSWFVYPFVLIYPILECNWKASRNQDAAKYSRYHLYFTLFMVFVYYGLSMLV